MHRSEATQSLTSLRVQARTPAVSAEPACARSKAAAASSSRACVAPAADSARTAPSSHAVSVAAAAARSPSPADAVPSRAIASCEAASLKRKALGEPEALSELADAGEPLVSRRVEPGHPALRGLARYTGLLRALQALARSEQGERGGRSETGQAGPIYEAMLEGRPWRELQAMGPASLQRACVPAIVEHLAQTARELGGAEMQRPLFERLAGAALTALETLASLHDGDRHLAETGLGPLVQALGGAQAPLDFIVTLLDLPGALARESDLPPALRETTARCVLRTRYRLEGDTRADTALVQGLLCEIAPRVCEDALDHCQLVDGSFHALRGAVDAFLDTGDKPMARLCRLADLLFRSVAEDRAAYDAELVMAAALAVMGQRHIGAADPSDFMHRITDTLLEAWLAATQGMRPAQAPEQAASFNLIMDRLADVRTLGWWPQGRRWDLDHAKAVILGSAQRMAPAYCRAVQHGFTLALEARVEGSEPASPVTGESQAALAPAASAGGGALAADATLAPCMGDGAAQEAQAAVEVVDPADAPTQPYFYDDLLLADEPETSEPPGPRSSAPPDTLG